MLLIGLIAGIIIGWLAEWIIDWWFWRNEDGPSIPFLADSKPNEELQRALDAARAETADLRRQLAACLADASQGKQEEREAGPEPEENIEDEIVASGPILTLAETTSTEAPPPDNLKLIKGIGRVYEGKLNAANIYTFAALAQASAAQLKAAIEPKEWQVLDFDGWIAQASSLAKSAPKTNNKTRGG